MRFVHLVQPVAEIALHANVTGIALAQGVLHAVVHAGGGGEHHQHHGGQHADAGKTRAVALHAVGHGGDGHEVAGLIVIAGVLLEHAAQGHGAGDEQQVRAHDDHDDRHEEPGQRRQRLADGHGQPVRAAQQGDAQHGQRPSGARRLLAYGLAAQQGHGADAVQLPQGAQEDQGVDGGEQAQRHEQRGDADGEGVGDLKMKEIQQGRLRQLGQQDAQRQADESGGAAGEQRLPQQDAGDVALAHTQHVV